MVLEAPIVSRLRSSVSVNFTDMAGITATASTAFFAVSISVNTWEWSPYNSQVQEMKILVLLFNSYGLRDT